MTESADEAADHTTDKADLEKRDRPQPSLATDQANLRAEDDAKPDKQERKAAMDALESHDTSIAEAQREREGDEDDDAA